MSHQHPVTPHLFCLSPLPLPFPISHFSRLLPATIFGYIVGNVSQMVGQLDVGAARKREQMNSVRNYMKEQELPRTLQLKIENFYDFYFEKMSVFDEQAILRKLPMSLQSQVVMFIGREQIEVFQSFFDGMCTELVVALLSALKPSFCLANHSLYVYGDGATDIFFLKNGELRKIEGPSKQLENDKREQYRRHLHRYVSGYNQNCEDKIEMYSYSYASGGGKEVKPSLRGDFGANETKGLEEGIAFKDFRNSERKIENGTIFGSLEFVTGTTRRNTVYARGYCTIFSFERSQVWKIVALHPDLAQEIQGMIARQLDKEIGGRRGGEGLSGLSKKSEKTVIAKFFKKKHTV